MSRPTSQPTHSTCRRTTRRAFLQAAGGSLAALYSASILDACGTTTAPVATAEPATVTPAPAVQKTITQVELMPNIPTPFHMRAWKAVAQGYDRLSFDFAAQGEHLPLIWWDKTHVNSDQDTFGQPSYVGDTRQTAGNAHEAINTIAAVLGASLSGLDKSQQNGYDWVSMQAAYLNTANGLNLVLDSSAGVTGRSFWYEIYPHVLIYALANRYPQASQLAGIIRLTADRWYDACVAMGGSETATPDFMVTAFDFVDMKPKFNGQWKEPDAAAGIAWLEYMAWTQTRDPRHLQAADWGLQFLEMLQTNPLYEVLLPFGAYLAVRMNAELGRSYDAHKLINWCFDGGSYIRSGWGVNARRWGDYDCHGLAGLRTQASGYAFAMNTFAWAGALAPIARYDARYARAIGKWLLNLANNSRLFYADGLPEDHQSSAFWKGDPDHVVAYEGLQEVGDQGQIPYAAGDAIKSRWGKTDFGLYGSSHVGLLGAIVGQTDDEKILQLDLLATDFFRAEAYPTYLFYNPYPEERTVHLQLSDGGQDLYDTVQHRFVQRGARSGAGLTLAPDTGTVLVLAPEGGDVSFRGRQMLINHVVVDYDHPATA